MRERLKSPGNDETVSSDMLSLLWAKRDVALIAWLAERRRLDAEARRMVLALPEDSRLSSDQRKLLARATKNANP